MPDALDTVAIVRGGVGGGTEGGGQEDEGSKRRKKERNKEGKNSRILHSVPVQDPRLDLPYIRIP